MTEGEIWAGLGPAPGRGGVWATGGGEVVHLYAEVSVPVRVPWWGSPQDSQKRIDSLLELFAKERLKNA